MSIGEEPGIAEQDATRSEHSSTVGETRRLLQLLGVDIRPDGMAVLQPTLPDSRSISTSVSRISKMAIYTNSDGLVSLLVLSAPSSSGAEAVKAVYIHEDGDLRMSGQVCEDGILFSLGSPLVRLPENSRTNMMLLFAPSAQMKLEVEACRGIIGRRISLVDADRHVVGDGVVGWF